jgi:hypothetical protein
MVEYKGCWLAKNSVAYELWAKNEIAKLDKHMKELDRNNEELIKRYQPKETAK